MILSGAHRTRLAILGGAALLAAYAWVLFGHVATAVGGSDSSGYFHSARMMISRTAVDKLPVFHRLGMDGKESWESWVFIPLGMVPGSSPGTAAPFYPPGFPLHVAAVALLFGWTTAPFFISPIAALLCLELVYLIARELALSRLASVAATTIVALCPFFVFQALQPMSDIVGMFWCLAAVFAALRTRRGRSACGLAAGFSLGVAVLVRPANLILLPAVLVSLRWRRWSIPAFLFGGVPPLLLLLRYDTAVFGAWHRTGYDVAGLRNAFSARPFFRRLAYYVEWTIRTLSPLVAGGALSAAADRKLPRIDRLLLFCWPAAYFVFHAFYDPYEPWWYLRYLLPAVPALAIACVVAWRDFVAHPLRATKARLAPLLSVAVLAVILFVEARQIRTHDLLSIGRGQKANLTAAHWTQRYVPDAGLVLSCEMSGALAFYSDRVPVRWDWLEPARFAVLDSRARAQGYSWYALLMPHEVEPAQRAAPGSWTLLSKVPGSDITLWRVER